LFLNLPVGGLDERGRCHEGRTAESRGDTAPAGAGTFSTAQPPPSRRREAALRIESGAIATSYTVGHPSVKLYVEDGLSGEGEQRMSPSVRSSDAPDPR